MTDVLTPLLLDPQPQRRWKVYGLHVTEPQPLGDFIVDSDTAGRLVIPAGFECDLNSIPRFLWWASTPSDYPEAGVVHDWAYRGNLPRAQADKLYAELLTYLGMGAARVAGRYMALRLFGGFAYGSHRPK